MNNEKTTAPTPDWDGKIHTPTPQPNDTHKGNGTSDLLAHDLPPVQHVAVADIAEVADDELPVVSLQPSASAKTETPEERLASLTVGLKMFYSVKDGKESVRREWDCSAPPPKDHVSLLGIRHALQRNPTFNRRVTAEIVWHLKNQVARANDQLEQGLPTIHLTSHEYGRMPQNQAAFLRRERWDQRAKVDPEFADLLKEHDDYLFTLQWLSQDMKRRVQEWEEPSQATAGGTQ